MLAEVTTGLVNKDFAHDQGASDEHCGQEVAHQTGMQLLIVATGYTLAEYEHCAPSHYEHGSN
jgi:hypothetical protein